jgi:hypothetical protein
MPNGPNDTTIIWAHGKLFFHSFLIFCFLGSKVLANGGNTMTLTPRTDPHDPMTTRTPHHCHEQLLAECIWGVRDLRGREHKTQGG